MATTKQKAPARQNLTKAQKAQSSRAKGKPTPRAPRGLGTAEQNRLKDSEFAFPRERKEPLVDAKHVRNAIAQFDQVEGVGDAERTAAWERIQSRRQEARR